MCAGPQFIAANWAAQYTLIILLRAVGAAIVFVVKLIAVGSNGVCQYECASFLCFFNCFLFPIITDPHTLQLNKFCPHGSRSEFL
jgi:hypothetical protein